MNAAPAPALGLLPLSLQRVTGRKQPTAPTNEARIRLYRFLAPVDKRNSFDWEAVRRARA